jgi:hypothetical protein
MAQPGLKLTILPLTPTPKCWNYRRALRCLAQVLNCTQEDAFPKKVTFTGLRCQSVAGPFSPHFQAGALSWDAVF